MASHNPFAAADLIAPIPETRDQATTTAWVRHFAALSLAAFATVTRTGHSLTAELAVAALAAAHAHTGDDTAADLWDLIPEYGALNGEWEEWLADTLDAHGINPADIDPRYNSGDFNSPTRAQHTAA